MDSIWYLVGCLGFFWLVLWSIRDFTKPSSRFWPFDARWMTRPTDPAPRGWQRAEPGRRRR